MSVVHCLAVMRYGLHLFAAIAGLRSLKEHPGLSGGKKGLVAAPRLLMTRTARSARYNTSETAGSSFRIIALEEMQAVFSIAAF